MTRRTYTDTEIEDFIEEAKDIGIGRAIRTMGYPSSWSTAQRWIKARGITVDIDELRQHAKEHHTFYVDDDALMVAEAGMERVKEQLLEEDLVPDDMKKVSEAYQKFANTWLIIKGKSNQITEHRSVGEMDLELQKIIDEENAKNNEAVKDYA